MSNICIPKDVALRLKTSLENGEIDANSIANLLPKERAALKSLLEDVVSEDLGVSVKPSEIKVIRDKARAIDNAQKVLGNDLGNPSKTQENINFFKAKKEMDDYLQSLSPSHNLKVATGTIGRAAMLASVKSPLLNIASNAEVGFSEAMARRIARLQFRGTDNKLALQYVKMVNKVYQESGYDLSRMTTLHDLGSSGQRVLGKVVHSQGKGSVRAVGRVAEDVVFKQMMGAPDVAFSSAHFADSVNLNARRIASKVLSQSGEKITKEQVTLRAKEIMNDAMRLEPVTPEGELLRAQGILDAQKATWTNTTWASRVSEGIRKVLNDVSGDLRAGDYLLPFVKTPANVIATGMDYAGMGIPKSLFNAVKAIRSGGFKELFSGEFRNKIAPDLVRSGLGITVAAILAHNLKKEDFVGAYDPSRAQIEQLRNSNTNSVRIGNKWISTDYFGPLAVPLTAMMYAKKYGSTPGEKTFQYGKGVLNQIYNLPGISDAYDYIKSHTYQKNNQTLAEAVKSTRDYVLNQAMSRLIPSILPDIANATDNKQRKASGLFQVFESKIPGLRNKLPEKKDVFGNTIQGESPLSDILFGSRVKTNRENDLVKELNRVSAEMDKPITFIDWDKSSMAALAQFKQKVGEQTYNQAKTEYGQKLNSNIDKLLNSYTYKKESDYEKLKDISGIDTTSMNDIFKKYGFKYDKKKSDMGDLLSSYDKGQYNKSPESPSNVFSLLAAYSSGFYQDPAGAWHALVSPERLKDVVSRKGFNKGIVRVERKKGLSELDAGNKATQVDHILADALGGTNDLSNLQVLSKSDNSIKGQLEAYLAEQVRMGNMTRKQAQEIDRNWKQNLSLINK